MPQCSFRFVARSSALACVASSLVTLAACSRAESRGAGERATGARTFSDAGITAQASALFAAAIEEAAKPRLFTWRSGGLKSGTLADIVASLNARGEFAFTEADFRRTDSVALQGYDYLRYEQVKSGDAVEHAAIRVWLSKASGLPILVEAHVVDPSKIGGAPVPGASSSAAARESLGANAVADADLIEKAQLKTRKIVGDSLQKSIALERIWSKGRLVRRVEAHTAQGVFRYDFDAAGDAVVSALHRAPLLADMAIPHEDNLQREPVLPEASVDVFKLWEYAYGDFSGDAKLPDRKQATSAVPLRNVLARYRTVPFGTVLDSRSRVYTDEELTPELRARFTPFWRASDRFLPNGAVPGSRVRLIGRNAAVFVSPDGGRAFQSPLLPPWSVAPHFDSVVYSRANDERGTYFVQPFWGRAALSPQDFAKRRAETDGTSASALDPRALLAEGFDDLQVYTGIDTFMEALRDSGFGDPEMSTRPFAAYLYEPSIEMRDNAFNDGDSIHFTTYTQVNMARDNTTIWHELGHGIQARVMGPHVDAESYGLWEGMADFVASLVVAHEYGLTDFQGRDELRIANRTWFNNTNEEHDEGEAYGGAMEDMLQAAMRKYGAREGQLRMSDLTFETMRLTRDHPALTPTVWFEHMLLADSLDHAVKGFKRTPGELSDLVREALRARDYAPGRKAARVLLRYDSKEVGGTDDLGGRYNPVSVPADSLSSPKAFDVALSFRNGEAGDSGFKFPMRVRVDFNVWALQGALRWQENDEPLEFTVASEKDVLKLPLTVRPGCDFSNRSDGGCSDYAYVRAWNAGDAANARPIVKKRFYVRLVK